MVSLVGAQACPQTPKAVAQTCSVKKVFLQISQNSQEKTCARVSFLIKLQAPATLLKKRLWYWCFPVDFAKFLRTPFLQNIPGSYSWNTAPEGWMVQGIEDYSLWNISNRINLRRGQTSTLSIRFPVFFSLGDASCFHVFPAGKGRLSLSAQGKKIMFSGKKYHLSR